MKIEPRALTGAQLPLQPTTHDGDRHPPAPPTWADAAPPVAPVEEVDPSHIDVSA